jgi:hypothetical protein
MTTIVPAGALAETAELCHNDGNAGAGITPAPPPSPAATAMPRPEAPATGRLVMAVLLVVLLAAGVALTVRVFHPGVMTYDALYVHMAAVKGEYGDWQSPVMVAIWRLIDPVAPGAASMFYLIVTLYWGAFAMLAATLMRSRPWVALLVPVLAVSPPAFVLAGVIWRDVLFTAGWLFAAALAFAVAARRKAVRLPVQALALALVATGVLIRPNTIAGAAILCIYVMWPARFLLRRAALAFIPVAVALAGLVHLVFYGVLDAKREHVIHALFVYDLAGITHFSGKNVFPVAWTDEQQRLLVAGCYDPRLWDVYWNRDCKFVMEKIEKQEGLFGTPALTRAWIGAILAEPRAYLAHRAAVMGALLAGDHLVGWFIDLDDPSATLRPDDPVFRRFDDIHEVLRRTPIFRIGLWILACLALTVAAWRRRCEPHGAFIVATGGSAVVYVASYAPIAVASDYRYGYWAVIAALAGFAVYLVQPPHRAGCVP